MSKRHFGRHLAWSIAIGLFIVCPHTAIRGADVVISDAPPTALIDYVSRDEPAFHWSLRNKQSTELGTVYDLDLTSQTWQGIVWKHVLHIYEPIHVELPRHVLLFVTGGSNGRRPGNSSVEMGLKLAQLCRARVATLYQVPNQPLFDGRKEDDLITETWLRYLETGDKNWPLLFPMVKSAVKAMDAVEEFVKSTWNQELEGFVITGASKRGWTSWLTPVADSRVLATAPMVIDVLNFQPQMRHQLETWGKYSEQIDDYTRKGLIKKPEEETPRDAQLRVMMDPFTYRKQLTLPKLLINGTNDRYWVVDAMRMYWYDLVGPKFVLQVSNAGHGLDGGHELVLQTVAAFFQHVARKSPWPEITWKQSRVENQLVLSITSSAPPQHARLWTAHSATKDFRDAKWNSSSLDVESGQLTMSVEKPKRGHVALFGELQFERNNLPFSLCTLIWRN